MKRYTPYLTDNYDPSSDATHTVAMEEDGEGEYITVSDHLTCIEKLRSMLRTVSLCATNECVDCKEHAELVLKEI